nr:MAG TPA: hypothetical protein [Caudoviricetes sp.]
MRRRVTRLIFMQKFWSVDETLNSRFVADGYTPKITYR